MRTFLKIFLSWVVLSVVINVIYNYVIVNYFSFVYARYMSIEESYIFSFICVLYIIIMRDVFIDIKKDLEGK